MTDKKKDARKDQEKITEAFEQIINSASEMPKDSNKNAIGLDIGTSKTVSAKKDSDDNNDYESQRNAFIRVDFSKFTRDILAQNKINHYKDGNDLIVYGDGAEIFANMLNTETRRPMRNGLLNANEPHAVPILKGIIDDLVPNNPPKDSPLCFSIPGAPADSETDLIYHENILTRILEEKGYAARSINEGMAIVFSELEKENFSGIGVSAGGGMCNVCLSFLSVPHISFSIVKGGDYIDDAVSSVTREVNTRVRDVKENEFDLNRKPRNDIEEALQIYYDDLIKTLVAAIKKRIEQTSKIPKVQAPIPIVLSGGTAKPSGFRDRFESFLSKVKFPLEISEVRMASDPLNATAKGALIAAMYED